MQDVRAATYEQIVAFDNQEKDSGIGKTDESTKNDESSEQECPEAEPLVKTVHASTSASSNESRFISAKLLKHPPAPQAPVIPAPGALTSVAAPFSFSSYATTDFLWTRCRPPADRTFTPCDVGGCNSGAHGKQHRVASGFQLAYPAQSCSNAVTTVALSSAVSSVGNERFQGRPVRSGESNRKYLEREIASINYEMGRIQFQCRRVGDRHGRQRSKSDDRFEGRSESTSAVRFQSPRLVPRMGTRLHDQCFRAAVQGCAQSEMASSQIRFSQVVLKRLDNDIDVHGPMSFSRTSVDAGTNRHGPMTGCGTSVDSGFDGHGPVTCCRASVDSGTGINGHGPLIYCRASVDNGFNGHGPVTSCCRGSVDSGTNRHGPVINNRASTDSGFDGHGPVTNCKTSVDSGGTDRHGKVSSGLSPYKRLSQALSFQKRSNFVEPEYPSTGKTKPKKNTSFPGSPVRQDKKLSQSDKTQPYLASCHGQNQDVAVEEEPGYGNWTHGRGAESRGIGFLQRIHPVLGGVGDPVTRGIFGETTRDSDLPLDHARLIHGLEFEAMTQQQRSHKIDQSIDAVSKLFAYCTEASVKNHAFAPAKLRQASLTEQTEQKHDTKSGAPVENKYLASPSKNAKAVKPVMAGTPLINLLYPIGSSSRPTTGTSHDLCRSASSHWVVRRRSDGTRYITRRPARTRILKERARQLAEERFSSTTDDDAASELKRGRYWNREERRRHLEMARDRRSRKELMQLQAKENAKANRSQFQQYQQDVLEATRRQRRNELLENFSTLQELLSQGRRETEEPPEGSQRHRPAIFHHQISPLVSVTTV